MSLCSACLHVLVPERDMVPPGDKTVIATELEVKMTTQLAWDP